MDQVLFTGEALADLLVEGDCLRFEQGIGMVGGLGCGLPHFEFGFDKVLRLLGLLSFQGAGHGGVRVIGVGVGEMR